MKTGGVIITGIPTIGRAIERGEEARGEGRREGRWEGKGGGKEVTERRERGREEHRILECGLITATHYTTVKWFICSLLSYLEN